MGRVNKYPGACSVCGARVPANGGTLQRSGAAWTVAHLACVESGAPEVVEFTLSSGATMRRNRRGLCIDAPCCGCCDA